MPYDLHYYWILLNCLYSFLKCTRVERILFFILDKIINCCVLSFALFSLPNNFFVWIIRVATHQNETNSLTFPWLFPDLEQNFTDLKHGNLYRKHNMLHIFLVFCLHVQCYAFLILNFLSLFLCLGAHNIQNDINFPDFSLTLSRIPNFSDQMQNSLTFPWPWKNFVLPWLFTDCGNPDNVY